MLQARLTVKGYLDGSVPSSAGVIAAEVWDSSSGRTKRVRLAGFKEHVRAVATARLAPADQPEPAAEVLDKPAKPARRR